MEDDYTALLAPQQPLPTFNPATPASYNPATPASYNPATPASYNPATPASYNPATPATYNPATPSSYNPSPTATSLPTYNQAASVASLPPSYNQVVASSSLPSFNQQTPAPLNTGGYPSALPNSANVLPQDTSVLAALGSPPAYPVQQQQQQPQQVANQNLPLLLTSVGSTPHNVAGTNTMHMMNGMQGSAGHHHGIQKGVIYAFSQYSPFISLSSTAHAPLSNCGDNENSNLGPEDVAEVRQMTSAAAAAAAPVHEHVNRSDSGKCQSGGELRLSELVEKLNLVHVPEGFCLVGAKSPMLPGMVLVAAVDKRYLPGDPATITMLGFSGNCVGCGASGFRYFTEFSTHINLKLATQPKKQKHLKYYITKNGDGNWCRGPIIPWKGTETRKRSVPAYNLPLLNKGEGMTSYAENSIKEQMQSFVSSMDSYGEPDTKKIKAEIRKEKKKLFMSSAADELSSIASTHSEESSNPAGSTGEDVALKLPVSVICGVRPVLLLCQQNSCKLPNSVSDIIVSDLLVGCFDFPDTIYQPAAKTNSTYKLSNSSIMSTGIPITAVDENNTAAASNRTNVEQNVANMLINLGTSSSGTAATTGGGPQNALDTVSSQKKDSPITNLPLTAAIILMTQHLCSLEDTSINKEQIELMFSKAKIELGGSTSSSLLNSQVMITSGLQLSLIVNLQCSASNGRVRLISSNHSFQNGLYKALRWIHDTFYMSSVSNKKLMIPNFVIILSTPTNGPIEFGILVTGVSHAKILAECLGISTIVRSPFEDDLVRLKKQFQLTTEVLRNLITAFDNKRGNMVYVPFNAYSGMRISNTQAEEYSPTVAPMGAQPIHTKGVFPNQAAMAQQLITQLRNVAENPEVLDLPSFLKVDLLIVVPPTVTLYYLTVKRLCESGILNFLDLETEDSSKNIELGEKYVISYSDWPESVKIWNEFVRKSSTSPETLFLLIFDQAQRYSLPNGMPDVLPNLKEILGSTNVIPLFVTSVPYMFQTRKSFIDPDNEVYWTDSKQMPGSTKYLDDQRVLINDQDMIYFGIKEFAESMQWDQQYALIRHEETFDSAVPKANRLNDINYSMVQGFVLLRLYQASMMVSGGIKPAEPYTVMSVINMVNDIIESPLRNTDGSGYMMMIRIPNKMLGKYFHEVLQKTRYSLGFHYRFDIIYDDGDQELEIGEYFLERMRVWKVESGWDKEKANKWRPRCLEELLDLPCILILAGENRSGETMPRSLKYVDLNIFNHSSFHRSTIESEIGAVACYLSVDSGTCSQLSSKPVLMNNLRSGFGNSYVCQMQNEQVSDHQTRTSYPFDLSACDEEKCDGCINKDHRHEHEDSKSHFSSKYPLPLVLVSKPVWHLLQSDRGTAHGLIHLNSDPHTRWIQSDRPLLTTMKPDRMSRHYRRWTDARPVRKVLTTPSLSTLSSPNGCSVDDNLTQTDDIAKLFSIGKDLDPEKQLPEGNVYLTEQLDHDDKDNEETDKDRYHPRALLLSGPPQAGKTGAYLHFAYLLHRMLVRLKRVDVYDNIITYVPSIEALTGRWPESARLKETKFVSGFLDMRLETCSQIHVCSSEKETTLQIVAQDKEKGTDSALVILAKTAAFDAYHHCDICRFYREGISNTVSQVYTYQVLNFGHAKRTLDVQIVIPPIHMKYFIVDETTNTLLNLILQPVEEETKVNRMNQHPLNTKTPIFMHSSGGEEEGLLNLFHAMKESDHMHMTFIKNSELTQYQKYWPNHIFFVLPEAFDRSSDSCIKNIIKMFATQNYHNEVARLQELECEEILVWPFILIVPDNLVMWQKTGKNVPHDSSDSDDEGDTTNGKNKKGNSESVISPLRDTASMLELLVTLESTPCLLEYGLIGFRPWSSFQDQSGLPTCLRTLVHSCFMINVQRMEPLSFASHIFIGEDIDIQLRLIEENVAACRFEHFSFMAKMTSRVTWRGNDNIPTLSSSLQQGGGAGDNYSHLVVAPDIELMKGINANPHLVMQKYLSLSSETLFPLAAGSSTLHVLVIGGYVNLGPMISTCVINCKSDADDIVPPECATQKTYAGLIIYNCVKKLTRDSLSRVKFVKDAQMVLVCKERYELRSEVLRLDFEESWRFRLRDEYQTATCGDEHQKAFYFLTGSYFLT